MKKIIFGLLATLLTIPIGTLAQTENIKVDVPDFKRFFLVTRENVNLRRLPNANSGKLMLWNSDAGSFDTYSKIFFSDTEAASFRSDPYTGAYSEPFHPYKDTYLPVNPEQLEPKDGWYNVLAATIDHMGNEGKGNSKLAWVSNQFGKIVDVCTDSSAKQIRLRSNPFMSTKEAEQAGKMKLVTEGDKRKSGAFKDFGMFCGWSDRAEQLSVFIPVITDNLVFVAGATFDVEVNTAQQQPVILETKIVEGFDHNYEKLIIKANSTDNIEENFKRYLLTCSDAEFSKVTSKLFPDNKVPTTDVYFKSPDGSTHSVSFKTYYLGNIPVKTYTLAELVGGTQKQVPSQTQESDIQYTGEIYTITDEAPQFPGGQKAMFEYIGNNFNFPAEPIKGRAILQFVVEKDGNLSNIKVIQSVDPLTDAEAIRVLKSMPKWTPGKMNGKSVRSKFALPIVFSN